MGEHVTIDMFRPTFGETVIHPLALGFTLFMGIMMLFLPRRYVIIPMLFATLFITAEQRIVIMDLDFNMIRILVLFGWARVLLKGEIKSFKLNRIDKVIILWAVSGIITYTILWKTSTAFIYRIGRAFNIIGLYFLFRILIRDFDDFFTITKALAIISIPLSIAMLIEHSSGKNVFAIFGGVPEITYIREGRLRCQGAFAHPILAGTFGATLVPLFVGIWGKGGKTRLLVFLGIIAATIITITSASSGPVLSYISGIVALSLWPLRKRMRLIFLGSIFTIIALQLYMKAPIWALVGRVSVVGGSTAYHRFTLIDQFTKRFNEWWLIGTRYTDHWGFHLFDITNHYIRIAVDGGLITLILFLAIIFLCVKGIGKSISILENIPGIDNIRLKQLCLWSLLSTLFAHLVSFMGVSYFDQIIVVWYLLISIISSISYTYIHKGMYKENRSLV